MTKGFCPICYAYVSRSALPMYNMRYIIIPFHFNPQKAACSGSGMPWQKALPERAKIVIEEIGQEI
jgi:hypothetical protein